MNRWTLLFLLPCLELQYLPSPHVSCSTVQRIHGRDRRVSRQRWLHMRPYLLPGKRPEMLPCTHGFPDCIGIAIDSQLAGPQSPHPRGFARPVLPPLFVQNLTGCDWSVSQSPTHMRHVRSTGAHPTRLPPQTTHMVWVAIA